MNVEKRSKIRQTWRSMIYRCLNPKNSDYPRYGGRGITVCDKWLENFEHFYEDMHENWFPGATLDRIDNNGNYEPENCRWILRAENSKKSCDDRIANGNHHFQNPEYRKNQSERMKGTIAVWDLVDQKYVRIHKELYHADRGRYLHLNSKEYKNLMSAA